MDEDHKALEETVYLLGEKVGRAGQVSTQRSPHMAGAILSELRSAQRDLESAILAAMNVMHSCGAAPEGAAGLLGFRWHLLNQGDRERFERLWYEIRASNVGDPGLRRRLRELLAVREG